MEKVTVYLSLGSNIEDRSEYLKTALDRIRELAGPITGTSSVYESEPWGFHAETPFLNQVAMVQTVIGAGELMDIFLSIEEDMGRVRNEKGYASRKIDIDILLYDAQVISEPGLKIPHPRMHERRFVLEPLAEIAPGLVHPVFGTTMEQLLDKCSDPCWVRLYKE